MSRKIVGVTVGTPISPEALKKKLNIEPDSGGNADQSGGLSATASALLITILRNGVYSTDQSANITALEAALASGGSDEPDVPVDPEKTLASISATYSGGDVLVGTSVLALTGIVVTAHYSDGSTETVTGYTLSGEIAEGSNTVTVSYGGKTTTFTVTGVAESGGDSGEELPEVLFELAEPMTFDGTNYLDTGIALVGDYTSDNCPAYSIYMECEPTDTSGDRFYFNSWSESAGVRAYYLDGYQGGSFYTKQFDKGGRESWGGIPSGDIGKIACVKEKGGFFRHTIYRSSEVAVRNEFLEVENVISERPSGSAIVSETDHLYIGAKMTNGVPSGSFVGTVHKFIVYSKALTNAEISELMGVEV